MPVMTRNLEIAVLAPDQRLTKKSIDLNGKPAPAAHLISCLMVSRGEIYPAAFAIECFQKQTYPNKELVIVSANADGQLQRYVEELADSRIRFTRAPDWTLGTLRNLTIGLARGDLVTTWDDDDLRHPRSLEVQYSALMATDAAMLCLLRLSLWEPARQRLALTQTRPWENSLLAWRYKMPEYPSLGKREDSHLMQRIAEKHSVALIDQPELYVYTVHGKNTWESSHFDQFFNKASHRFEGADYERMHRQLDAHVPMMRYAEALLSAASAKAE